MLALLLVMLTLLHPAWGQQPTEVPPGYRLGARDLVRVDVFQEPGLSGELEVSEEGSIDVALLGRLQVRGLTLGELDALLTERFARDFLVSPQVSVQITRFGSQAVRVLGAVKKPGVYPLSGPTSVLELIALAGGLGADGVNEVRITRRGVPEPIVLRLDQAAIEESAWMLVEGDSVFLPSPRVVYVAGQVNRPGAVAFAEGLTLSQAVILAGGSKSGANLSRVWIKGPEGPQRVNLKRVLRGREADPVLRPDDQVMVAESVL